MMGGIVSRLRLVTIKVRPLSSSKRAGRNNLRINPSAIYLSEAGHNKGKVPHVQVSVS